MIELGKLRYLPFSMENLEFGYSLEQDALTTFFSRGIAINLQGIESYKKMVEEDISTGNRKRILITYDGNEIGIGSIYENQGMPKKAGVGLMLRRDFWNSHIGSVSTIILVEMLFYFMDYHRIEAWSAEYNRRAHRVLERAGFVLEGKLRESLYTNGKYYSWYIFGNLRKEYYERRENILKEGMMEYYDEYRRFLEIFLKDDRSNNENSKK